MKRLLYLLSACLMTFGFSACNDDDDNLKLQDISVEFAVSAWTAKPSASA